MGEREPRESQRRHATVIFADISGFTAMSEKLDPEEVARVMNACFRMVERIVHEHGGVIDKYIGDCVMALFGAPHAIEKAAHLALRASLEIRAGIGRFNEEETLRVPIDVHIGVNSGLVIAGDVGGDIKRDFTVMGDAVNLAARLEDASEKGQIFVGPVTYDTTKDEFEYRPLKPLDLKGKSEPVRAYELLGMRPEPETRRLGLGSRQISASFVGREKELRLIHAKVAEVLSGKGGIVSIVGDPGIGKSRLLAEIATRCDLTSARTLVGRSDAISTQRSFHPFVELVRGWCGIKRDGTDASSFAKLDAALRTIAAGGADEMLPFVATLMGIRASGMHEERLAGIEGEALEKLILKAMRDFFVALAQDRPLIASFEDLHWADLSSVKLLESLLRLSSDHPILFLLTFRPGFTETSGRLLDMIQSRYSEQHVEMALAPLDTDDSGTMIRSLLKLDHLPNVARELIISRADGNPFFIEEVIRALIDQGAIELIGGRLRITERIDSATVPGTIQEVITVRVEQLDDDSRRVLQVAAVIGRSFYHRLLLELLGGQLDLEPTIALLKERQVVEERQVRRTGSARRQTLNSEREFVFKHALIQETVYDSLLKSRRKELHLRVAQAIEKVFADRLIDFYGMLALHYTHGESLERAEVFLFKAGEEAVRSAASSEALGYFREAYRIYRAIHGEGGDPAKKLQLEKSIAMALLLTGRLAEARAHFDRALMLLGERVARTKGQAYRQALADLVRILARIYVLRGRMSKRPSTPEQREAVALLYSRARVESVADPEWFLFDSLYMTGRLTRMDPRTVEQAFAPWAGVALLFSYSGLSFDLSRRVSAVAKSLLREERSNDLLTYHLMNFMRNYFEGSWSEPSGVDDALIEKVLRTGQLWDVDTFLGIDAEKQVDLGEFAAAERRLVKIDELVNDYGYGFAETNRLALTALLALGRRELPSALDAVERYEQRPEEMLNLLALGTKAKILLLSGALEVAGETLERATHLLKRIGRATPFHSGAYRTSCLFYEVLRLERALEGGDPQSARDARRSGLRHARVALRTAKRMARIRTETFRLIGTLHWLSDQPRKATSWWERSIIEAERLGARPELARTHREVGRWIAREGREREVAGKDAESHLAHAERLFAELGLDTELGELREARRARSAA